MFWIIFIIHKAKPSRHNDRESKNSRVDHFEREIREKGLENMRAEGLQWLKEQLAASVTA